MTVSHVIWSYHCKSCNQHATWWVVANRMWSDHHDISIMTWLWWPIHRNYQQKMHTPFAIIWYTFSSLITSKAIQVLQKLFNSFTISRILNESWWKASPWCNDCHSTECYRRYSMVLARCKCSDCVMTGFKMSCTILPGVSNERWLKNFCDKNNIIVPDWPTRLSGPYGTWNSNNYFCPT